MIESIVLYVYIVIVMTKRLLLLVVAINTNSQASQRRRSIFVDRDPRFLVKVAAPKYHITVHHESGLEKVFYLFRNLIISYIYIYIWINGHIMFFIYRFTSSPRLYVAIERIRAKIVDS